MNLWQSVWVADNKEARSELLKLICVQISTGNTIEQRTEIYASQHFQISLTTNVLCYMDTSELFTFIKI